MHPVQVGGDFAHDLGRWRFYGGGGWEGVGALDDTLIPSKVKLYLHSFEIFHRRHLHQPEVDLKISITQEWSTESLSDWQA